MQRSTAVASPLAMSLAASLLISCGGGGGAPAEHTTVEADRGAVSGAGLPAPEVRLESLEVASGPLPLDAARASVARARSGVEYCLEGSSLRVEGRADVRLRVAPDGSVARSGTDRVEGLDPEVVFCVVRALRGVRFPSGEADSIVLVRLAFADPRDVTASSADPPPVLHEPADDPPGPADASAQGGGALDEPTP